MSSIDWIRPALIRSQPQSMADPGVAQVLALSAMGGDVAALVGGEGSGPCEEEGHWGK